MSVLEELREYERRVIERLNELKPLVDEYHQLEQLAERLGLDRDATAKPRRQSRPVKRSRTTTALPGSSRGAKPGRKPHRRDQVLQLINERPGITVPDLGKAIGVDPTGLYRVVRQLEKEGLVTKSGMEVSPAR